jgi:hypothetical protein
LRRLTLEVIAGGVAGSSRLAVADLAADLSDRKVPAKRRVGIILPLRLGQASLRV